jgi:hypothetical protein
MLLTLLTFGLLQQATFQGATTPPSGDTTGYWQQGIHYRILATLDEEQSKLRAEGTLTYVNHSPDTLREMYFHQYLNAFRPGSKWSARDEKENRVRFQDLAEPNYGYERFRQAPVVGGVPVIVDYPGAPDSTVVHFKLPRALPPGDSVDIRFVWDARPSTVTRRQGRRGRTYDFAQWYPKVAVYDRAGWEPNALVPAGELYGEYGTYDVTMIVKNDQVLASTGVPVSGDPGWARVSRTGPPRLADEAYELKSQESPKPAPTPTDSLGGAVPSGYRAVRFLAKNVHHFAWSASPDYRYEGTTYVRQVPRTHFPTWDTVSVHVLFKPGDDTTWGGGRAVERTLVALRWLESIYGPYAYPQITNVHRLDPGGTEFPMMVMDGSASQGLILHEAGHIFTYGILGNNEWRSGWMDEGLTDYQTDWAQKLTPQERIGVALPPARLPEGYRVEAVSIPPNDSTNLDQWKLEVEGRAEPIGTSAADFSEFGIYNEMIYGRAKLMYGQLRDVMGDSAFKTFLRDYYATWALKHVDERAMKGAAERAYGHALSWFFEQWVHGTGLMDYSVEGQSTTGGNGAYRTSVRVVRRGELRHPMPVGVQTGSGWTIGRADALVDDQVVVVETREQPTRIELDPYHVTWDWDWRNNRPTGYLITLPEPKIAYNWPYLDQSDRSHTLVALSPALWISQPQGGIIGVRAKTNYLSDVDIHDGGIGFSTRNAKSPTGAKASDLSRLQVWARAENIYLPWVDSRPLMGWAGDVNYVDGLFKTGLSKNWDLSPFIFTPGPKISVKAYATFSVPSDSLMLPEQWSPSTVTEIGGSGSYRSAILADSEFVTAKASLGLGLAASALASRTEHTRGYLRGEGSVGAVRNLAGTASQLHLRIYGGIAHNAPRQRSIFASSQDPFETFRNDLWRARGALFKRNGFNYLPLGGAALRGFKTDVALDGALAANAEFVQRLVDVKGQWGRGSLSLSFFGDAGTATAKYTALQDHSLTDAGVGLVARGRIYDRPVYVRLDSPFFVDHSGLAGGTGLGGRGSIARRWTITVGDLWPY